MRDRLYRSRGDRMLFGVAGGLGRYLNVDSTIVRLVWVLLFFAAGTGILLYIIAAILIPEEPEGMAAAATSGDPAAAGGPGGGDVPPTAPRRDGSGAILIGLVLVLVGGWLLLERFLPDIDGRVVWPAILLVVGLALVLGSMRARGRP